ncbi:helix-turn-helix domain-containing protein [Puniceicoccus vermicola]|uniref:Helix-turn-helix transcriptional regulator n=1 Tax=Puniceicoccus vermicola TaxID=388746 RepID=A0A7X1E431_9BACT|nr:AraC family transcriptional regulator [Puniceicoccus vermicola]MBC2602150.1 helix-turn-helix transcriptional regulator [Puniceicoccus vermicola]
MNLKNYENNRTVYRNITGSRLGSALSCGFLNKSGISNDIENEHYDRLAMVYLLRGTGHYHDSHGIHSPLAAGDIIFRCPDRHHTNSVDPQSQWLECFVSVRQEWYTLLCDLGLMTPGDPVIRLGTRPEIPERIARLIRQMESSDTVLANSDHEFEIIALIRQVLRRNLESQADRQAHREELEKCRELIRTRATEPADLATIVEPIGLSYSRIRSLFQKRFGITPGNYRIQVRIENACALLEASSLTIKEIADELGYPDPYTFSKQFRQRTGISPKKWRNRKA